MKGLRTVIGVLLAVGLIIGFAGCEDEDTISKADRCGNSIIKFQKNDCEPWSVSGCLSYPNATVSCVLRASGESKGETCYEMYVCLAVANFCWYAIWECEVADELEEKYDLEFDNLYDAWAYCVELDEETLECILDVGYNCSALAECLGIELPE